MFEHPSVWKHDVCVCVDQQQWVQTLLLCGDLRFNGVKPTQSPALCRKLFPCWNQSPHQADCPDPIGGSATLEALLKKPVSYFLCIITQSLLVSENRIRLILNQQLSVFQRLLMSVHLCRWCVQLFRFEAEDKPVKTGQRCRPVWQEEEVFCKVLLPRFFLEIF